MADARVIPRPSGRARGAAAIAAAGAGAVLRALFERADVADLGARVRGAAVLSVAAFAATAALIPELAPMFLRARLCGRDINKSPAPSPPKGQTGQAEGQLHGQQVQQIQQSHEQALVPESLGLVAATVYLIVLCLLHGADLRGMDGDVGGEARLYTAAMASVTFMVLLGFADDVLDLRWRYNLALPLVASMPLLVNYAGSTSVMVPRPLEAPASWMASRVFGAPGAVAPRLVDIGWAYYVYMALLSIFCTNAINIYAGINGLEAGQAVVIAAFVLLHNSSCFSPQVAVDNLEVLRAHHAFSVDLMLPFAGVTLGLLCHNWYPSRVFVGDTFCYFAGMTFAMASILGHYSETLLLFFIPQLINFVYSLPQLVGIVHCPRHRLPRLNTETGKLEAVRSHMNLVNLTLMITGPLYERDLCVLLLLLQCVCCAAGLAMRAAAVAYISSL